MEALLIADITPSPLNPRGSMDPKLMDELTDSVHAHGVLQPILVRKMKKGFEVVAGHRRLAAARGAGLTEIPALVRDLTDEQTLEIQLIENLQRADIHPLDEAKGYHELLRQPGYTKDGAAKIAARVGRSAKYVYDRVKLLQLTKPAQKVFLEGKITAGHAILLARLKPVDQARAMAMNGHGGGGVFQAEHLLWNPDDSEETASEEAIKAKSVRELEAWIDEHVRFDPKKDADPMLFPETAAVLEEKVTVIPITHNHHIQEEAREGRTFGPRSWERADGQKGSKKCEHSVTGLIVVGPGRGDAFQICIAKEKCKVHWGSWQRERAKNAKMRASTNGGGEKASRKATEDRYEAQAQKLKAEKSRWEKALPVILQELAVAVQGAPIGHLDKIVLSGMNGDPKAAAKYVPRGKTPEDFVRHLAFIALHDLSPAWSADHLRDMAKEVGIDVAKILNQVVPVEKVAKAVKPKKKAAK